MAIGDDRVGVSSLTNSRTVDFTGVSDSANKITKSVSDLTKSGVNILNGVSEKSKNIFSKPEIKEQNVDTSGLGMFESILCGKIPSLNIRWPAFDFEFDTNFEGFNIEICGKTKNINPIDTALTIVDKLQEPKKFVGEIKNEFLNSMLDSELGNQLRNFGLNGIPECLSDRTKWDLINGDFAGIGSSIEERVDLYDKLNLDGCSKNIAELMGVPRIVKESAMTNILDSLTGNDEKIATNYFNHSYSYYGNSALSSARSSFLKNSTGNYLPKLGFISNTIGNGDTREVDDIIVGNSRNITRTYNENIKPEDVVYIRTDTEAVMKSLEMMKDEEIKEIDPKVAILAINTLDPNWNKDDENNFTSYKVANNKAMKEVSEKIVLAKKPEINLTGDSTSSKINLMDELVVINEFKCI